MYTCKYIKCIPTYVFVLYKKKKIFYENQQKSSRFLIFWSICPKYGVGIRQPIFELIVKMDLTRKCWWTPLFYSKVHSPVIFIWRIRNNIKRWGQLFFSNGMLPLKGLCHKIQKSIFVVWCQMCFLFFLSWFIDFYIAWLFFKLKTKILINIKQIYFKFADFFQTLLKLLFIQN